MRLLFEVNTEQAIMRLNRLSSWLDLSADGVTASGALPVAIGDVLMGVPP